MQKPMLGTCRNLFIRLLPQHLVLTLRNKKSIEYFATFTNYISSQERGALIFKNTPVDE